MTSIVTNTAAQIAQNNLRTTFADINSSTARLTSGFRIVNASDDAAGLAIGTGLSTDVSTLSTALANTAQASSLLNVADGALSQISAILERQKELAVQANSGTLSTTELGFLNTEFQGLKSQIDDIASQTNFNGINLLNGNAAGTSNATTNTSATITYTDVGTLGTSALASTGATAFSIDTSGGTDLSLQGSLSSVTVTGTYGSGNTDIGFQLLINGSLYTVDNINVNSAVAATADLTVELANTATGMEISIVLDSVALAALDTTDNQTGVNTLVSGIQADIDALTIYQARTFTDGTSGSVFKTNDVVGTAIDGLTGADFTLTSDSYTTSLAPTIESFSVTAETATTDGDITVVIGGSTFSTAAGAFNSTSADITGAAVTLTSSDDSNEIFVIDFTQANQVTVAVNSTSSAQALEDALNAGFGVGSAGALDFQVGLASTDLISITIADVRTAAIYLDSSDVSQTLSLTTTSNANTASAVLDNAINSILSARAGIGADQSRFNFAAANLAITITNLDASRGGFLDTNIAEESTAFASQQVRQQAGISVLAQTNLLPQNLLKLLG